MRCATGNQAGDIIVVDGLSFCGTVGGFNGCASTNGSLVLTNDAPDATWSHEFGHVQGLGHQPACTNTCGMTNACSCGSAGASKANIMFCQGCAGRNAIRAAECSAYRVAI